MNHSLKFILSSTACMVLGSFPSSYAQQVTNPENNIPVTITPGTPPQAPHPGLVDMANLPVYGYNYVRTKMPDKPAATVGSSYVRETTNFFDGLGRPLQSVARVAHPSGYDLVQHKVYDETGKEVYQYLPFAKPAGLSTGAFTYNPKARMREFYDNLGPDEPPYSETKFDNSPLNRVTKQMQPGKSWVGSGRGLQSAYRGNTAADGVRRWSIANTVGAVPVPAGAYDANDLNVVQLTDEDGKLVLEYKDKQGRLVLKKVKSSDCTATPHCGYACTYYVYDDMQRLRFVIPPKAVEEIDGGWYPSGVPELCYSYSYDGRGRLIEKKIPGKAKEEFVYDKRDRMVFHRDGNMTDSDQWAFYIYDAMNRPICNGLCLSADLRSTVQGYMDDNVSYNAPNLLFYQKDYNLYNVYPQQLTNATPYAYTFYDNYDQVSFGFDAAQFSGITLPVDGTVVPSVFSSAVQGKVTGSWSRVKDPANPGNEIWLRSAMYYDDKGRLIQTHSDNLKGGVEISSNIYYFQGMPWKNILRHQNPVAKSIAGTSDGPHHEYRIVTTTTANVRYGGGTDQVVSIRQKIDNGIDYQLGNYFYDHMGRIVTKQTSGANVLQAYNVRGFLDHIQVANFNNDPGNTHIFEENLYYDKGFESKLYNGNIAGITWRKAGAAAPLEAYGYSYDPLNRLTHAEYRMNESSTWSNANYNYTASGINYDINGNILHMAQWVPQPGPGSSPILMDELYYNYESGSNQLIRVKDDVSASTTAPLGLPDFKDNADLTNEYTYDANGNLTRDDNKDIGEITYSYLNKPEVINVQYKGKITNWYDAAGNRLRKEVRDKDDNKDIYDYIGNFVYKNDTLQYILNSEGRARPVANNQQLTKFKYDYFVKDHLGNVRSTVTAEPINDIYLASHEIGSANVEQLVFDNIPNVRDAKPGDPDHMAARLNASDPSRRVGTAIMLRTMPGDKFTISADAFYEGDYQQNDVVGSQSIVESLMSALLNGNTYAGVPIAELPDNVRTIKEAFENLALPGQLENLVQATNDPNAPRAHLNVLFFNDKLELVEGGSSITQVPAVPMGGNMGGFTTLTPVGPITGGGTQACCIAPGPGYAVIYIDNQSIGKDVWFDNIMIEHYTGKVQEESHYYPYGLTLQTSAELNYKEQPYKYNGKELERSFGLEMYDFHARQLDPQLGRFIGLDPHADLYTDISPYASMNNSPANYIDPNGKDARVGIQKDEEGNTTITLSSTIYVKGYRAEQRVREYNQFLKDSPQLLTNTVKNEDGTTTTTNIDLKYELNTNESEVRVTNEETRNGDNLMMLADDEARPSAAFVDKTVVDPQTGKVTVEKFTNFKARLGNKDSDLGNSYGSPTTAFHESMHLFGLNDWYRKYTDIKKVGTNDIMVNSLPTNTKPHMHQIHWNNWGQRAKLQQQSTNSNNFILNRPVEWP